MTTLAEWLESVLDPTDPIPVQRSEESYQFPGSASQAEIEYDVISVTPIGTDELRPEYDPDLEIEGDTSGPGGAPATGGIVYRSCGNRVWTVEVRVVCGFQDTDQALTYANTIRDRMVLPSHLRALRALGFAFQTAGPVTDAGEIDEGGRVLGVYVFEVFLNAASNVTDEPVTTIEHVEIDPEIT